MFFGFAVHSSGCFVDGRRSNSCRLAGMTPKPRGQRHLSREQIESGLHRQKVGGAWDEIGPLQLSFLRESGLSASDRLLDVGCGALRGGVHFVRYLDDGRYFGMDVESSLLDAGRYELERAGLSDKRVNLLADGDFRFGRFEQSFDYALAVSLFTHLDLNTIAKCLRRLRPVLTGSLYATFFEAPNRVHLKPIKRERERERERRFRDILRPRPLPLLSG